jgi:hypothetical protein
MKNNIRLQHLEMACHEEQYQKIPVQSVPITTKVMSPNLAHRERGVFDTTLCDQVCQWLATGRWFSLVSSTNKTDRHDITEILLKVALNTINQIKSDIKPAGDNFSCLNGCSIVFLSFNHLTITLFSLSINFIKFVWIISIYTIQCTKTFILSNFNFCPLSWHFCSEANTNKIEKIQERALRFIYNDYNSTYESLLIVSKWLIYPIYLNIYLTFLTHLTA